MYVCVCVSKKVNREEEKKNIREKRIRKREKWNRRSKVGGRKKRKNKEKKVTFASKILFLLASWWSKKRKTLSPLSLSLLTFPTSLDVVVVSRIYVTGQSTKRKNRQIKDSLFICVCVWEKKKFYSNASIGRKRKRKWNSRVICFSSKGENKKRKKKKMYKL